RRFLPGRTPAVVDGREGEDQGLAVSAVVQAMPEPTIMASEAGRDNPRTCARPGPGDWRRDGEST
ncbi:MAG: hypothetical protein ACREPL_02010, partial [Rhodanobacteraceae bacterium]